MPPRNVQLKWNGPAFKKKIVKATVKAINRTMADCVITFKGNHPGWNNVSGTAEGSVRITQFAEQRSKKEVYGQWGSVDVNYMTFLETNRGSALRRTADSIYPKLRRYLREELS